MKKHMLAGLFFVFTFSFSQEDSASALGSATPETSVEERIVAPSNEQLHTTTEEDKRMVMEQLHICKNSLNKIINHGSMKVYEHEIDLLLNNLRIKEVSDLGLYEIQDLRQEMISKLSDLQLNEEERQLLKQVNSMERDAMKWNALSNALNPTLLMVGGGSPQQMIGQLVFNVGISAVRSAVEYKSAGAEQNIRELKERFAIRKKDLQAFKELRTKVYKTENDIFNNHGKTLKLAEEDRTTESDEEEFEKIISLEDPYQRITNMENGGFSEQFNRFKDYYYYLGMAYLDNQKSADSAKALELLSQFVEKTKETPLFRGDEKLGAAALVLLANEKNEEKRKNLIGIVKKHLRHNGIALIQCAQAYFELAKINPMHEKKGLEILIDLIGDIFVSDNKELAFRLLIDRMNSVVKFGLEDRFYRLVKGAEGLDFSTYINYLWKFKTSMLNKNVDFVSMEIPQEGSCNKWEWSCQNFHYDIKIGLNKNFKFNLDETLMYTEMYNHDKGFLNVTQYKVHHKKAFTLKELRESKAKDFFEINPEAIYYFVRPVIIDSLYTMIDSLKQADIEDCGIFNSKPGNPKFGSCEAHKDDLVKFWKKYKDEKPYLEASYIERDSKLKSFQERNDFFAQDDSKKINFTGDNLAYNPYMIKNVFSSDVKPRVLMFIKFVFPEINSVFPELDSESKNKKIIMTYVKYIGKKPVLYSVEDYKKIYFVESKKFVAK